MAQSTMKDVAKIAGVSQPTVSHVINGTAPISETVTKKVNKVIKELGYVPNAMARSLKTNKSNIIGLIVPDVSISFYAEMVKAIETRLRQKGFVVFLCNSFYDGEREFKYINTLVEHNALGVIFGSDVIDKRTQGLIEHNKMPVIMLDTTRSGDLPFYVKVDNYVLAKLAVSHLYDIGAREIGYVTEPLRSSVLNFRMESFKKVMKEFGLTLDKKHIFEAQNEYENYSKIKIGYNLAANVVLNSHLDAVFCSSDEVAYGVIDRLKKNGVKIPEEIAIMGCDNDAFSSLISPSLSTIWQPITQMAEICVKTMLNVVKGETPDNIGVCLEPNIIIRESTMKIK